MPFILYKKSKILFAVALLAAGLFVIFNATEPESVQPEPTCEVVSGDEHIYRGQCLPDDLEVETLLLSPRASYLYNKQYLDIRAKIMVEQLINDAEKDGMCLTVSSGYRTRIQQELLLEGEEDTSYIAPVGGSEHQTGLAVDFRACPMANGVRDDSVERPELVGELDELPEYQWLVENASRYGFEQSYTEENAEETGYPAEVWHWKLVIK